MSCIFASIFDIFRIGYFLLVFDLVIQTYKNYCMYLYSKEYLSSLSFLENYPLILINTFTCYKIEYTLYVCIEEDQKSFKYLCKVLPKYYNFHIWYTYTLNPTLQVWTTKGPQMLPTVHFMLFKGNHF